MDRNEINTNELTIHGEDPSNEARIMVEEDVYIIVTQAFCPNGHNLVGVGPHKFDGYPGIAVKVVEGENVGLVEMSPFHGDRSKFGDGFTDGAKVKVLCPVCDSELPVLGKCNCEDGELRIIYLTPKLKETHMIAVCDKWGCYLSRVIDDNELFSEFTEAWE